MKWRKHRPSIRSRYDTIQAYYNDMTALALDETLTNEDRLSMIQHNHTQAALRFQEYFDVDIRVMNSK